MKISVVLSVYNGAAYVAEAVQSILDQTEPSFEVIVVDDGSTDGTGALLGQIRDERVRIVSLPVNCGIATARNVGMSCVQGDYMAVMDADDVCLPDRLQTQIRFMEENPGVHIVGGRVIRTAENTEAEIDRTIHPDSDGEIKANLLLMNGSAMIHPTMMVRMSFIREHALRYPPPPRGRVGIDHEFWIKCVARGAVFANVPEMLLKKRRHSANVTLFNRDPAVAHKKVISRSEILSLYYPDLSTRETRALAALFAENSVLSAFDAALGIAAGDKALSDQVSHYGESKYLLRQILENTISRWLTALSPSSDS